MFALSYSLQQYTEGICWIIQLGNIMTVLAFAIPKQKCLFLSSAAYILTMAAEMEMLYNEILHRAYGPVSYLLV